VLPADIDLQQASMLTINPPAASLILSEFVGLKPGDWVLQNAGNSGVGRSVIAIAKARGIRTASIVRRPELVPELVDRGADLVVVESKDAMAQLRVGIDGGHVALGIDGVGRDSMAMLSAVVSTGAALVNYSMLGGDRVSLPASLLTFKKLKVSGFFMYHAEHQQALPAAVSEGVALMAAGMLHFPVAAVYPIRDIKMAVAHAVRGGKVLLDMAD
jgi:NADPH:quinone reductase-like Zn-dependent oxidoreductase